MPRLADIINEPNFDPATSLLPSWATPFTGATSGVTPSFINQVFIKTDETPKELYISTGTNAGDIELVSSGGDPGGGSSTTDGIYTVDISGTPAVTGVAPRGFTIFRFVGSLRNTGTTDSRTHFLQAGSTAVYTDGVDYDSGVTTIIDISETINKVGQIGVYVILPFEESSGRSYTAFDATYYGGFSQSIVSSNPVGAATDGDVVLWFDLLASTQNWTDFGGNIVTVGTSGSISGLSIHEMGGTVQFDINV